MSESGDYTPAPHWTGYDFACARRAYDKDVVARGAVSAASVGLTEVVPDRLTCEAEAPFVIMCDITGSMGDWPATIFSKLPYLEHEGREYLGQDMEICFAAIGDHTCHDKYPLQVRPFVKGAELKTSLEKLIIVGGGGGDSEESYELGAAYFAENCDCPKAVRKPLMIIIGDEGIHNALNAEDAKTHCKVNTYKGVKTPKELFAKLRQKFEVYIIRKPYQVVGQGSSPANDKIQRQWEELLGADHVVSLPEAARVVDVIFGILGEYTGRYDEFVAELRQRQGKDADGEHKINVVLASLRSIHEPAKAKSMKALPPARAKSITRKPSRAKSNKADSDSVSLADDE